MSMGNVDFENLNLGNLGGLTNEEIAELIRRTQEQQQQTPTPAPTFPAELLPIGMVDTPAGIFDQTPAPTFPAELLPIGMVDTPPGTADTIPIPPEETTPTPPPTSTFDTGPTPNAGQQDAKDILKRFLANYKLDTLSDKIWDLLQKGVILNPNDPDEIGRAVSDTPEYAQRFPANIARRNAGLPEKSLSEYLQLEQAYSGAMRGAGLPPGFYDSPDDFSKFIAGDVSVAEVQSRIDDGYRAVTEANPDVVAQMKKLYNIDEGGLAAYFLDPARAAPVIKKQARAAQIAAEASRQAGFQLGVGMAEQLATEGFTAEEARTGFGQIASQQQLAAPLMAGEEALTTEEQIGATFGTSAAARQRVETRRRRRQAAFEAGGGFAGMGGQQATGLTTVGE